MTDPKTWAEMSTEEQAAVALGRSPVKATYGGSCFECGGLIVAGVTVARLTSGMGASGEIHLQQVHDRCP